MTCQIMVSLAALLSYCSTAAAQTMWDLEPYKVQVLVAVPRDGRPLPVVRDSLLSHIQERSAAVMGSLWDVRAELSTGLLARRMIRSLDELSADELLQHPSAENDKLILVAISASGGGYMLASREYDVATRVLGRGRTSTVLQSELLAEAVFRAARDVFAPLGRVTVDPAGGATLRVRGGRRPLPDGAGPLVRTGDVFLPILRRNDRTGKSAANGIQIVPWTLLVAESDGSVDVPCRVESSFRRPLAARRRGRSDQLALLVTSPTGPSRLVLRAATRPDQPLADYSVYSRAASGSVLIGRTDRSGEVLVPPTQDRLRVLYVKQGGQLLARLPLVPGLQPTFIAEIPDDPSRLRIEGFVTGLQDQLVDLVARREILIARARKLIEQGKPDQAQRSVDELEQLPNRQFFQQQLAEQRRDTQAENTLAQSRIAQLLQDTEQLLVSFLDPRPINELRSALDKAK